MRWSRYSPAESSSTSANRARNSLPPHFCEQTRSIALQSTSPLRPTLSPACVRPGWSGLSEVCSGLQLGLSGPSVGRRRGEELPPLDEWEGVLAQPSTQRRRAGDDEQDAESRDHTSIQL